MKKQLFQSCTVLIALGLCIAYAEERPVNHDMMNPNTMDHGAIQKGGTMSDGAPGIGVIHSIDTANRMINLTHEPMPELGWPIMTMDLPATKRVDLSDLKAGDEVNFKLKLGRDKRYRIIEIAPRAEPAEDK